jgi:lauroyl/myristoyl acyltransferase
LRDSRNTYYSPLISGKLSSSLAQRYITVNVDSAIHSRLGPAAAGALARTVPPPLLRVIAIRLARGYVRRSRGELCDAVRHNQAVVRGVSPTHPDAIAGLQEVLVNAALSLVDLYRAVARGRRAVLEMCHIDDEVRRSGDDCLERGRGLILAGLHMVGFELLIVRLGLMGYDVQALSDAHPSASHRSENAVRRRFGVLATPVSRAAVAAAESRLERNGVVVTGVDIPTRRGEALVFFHREARLPTLHAELAIRHGAPICLIVPRRDGDDRYSVEVGQVFLDDGGEPTSSRVRELTQSVLSAAEQAIARRPGHWKMVRPVWPERVPS